MPFPGDLTTITVTGTYRNGDGSPQSGTVTFTPSTDLVDTTGAVIVRAAAVPAPLYDGVLSIPLLCTDNADLGPSGWYWIVAEEITGAATRTYDVLIPHSGTSVDLSALAPVSPGPAVSTLYGVLAASNTNTWASNQVFTGGIKVPAGAAAGDVLTSDASGNISLQAPTGGGSTTFSRQVVIAADGPGSAVTAPVGTWTPTYLMASDTGGVWSGWINISDGAQNDAISFDFACGAGTYQLELRHLPYNNRGIYAVQIDGTPVGAIDGYAGSLGAGRSLLAGISLAAGAHVITLLMASKNASSSGYIALVERLMLTRTA